MTTSTKRPDGGEWKLVPSTEFDRFKREAEALARCCDYNVREAFVIAAGALDRAMKSTPTNESPAPQTGRDLEPVLMMQPKDCQFIKHGGCSYPHCECT